MTLNRRSGESRNQHAESSSACWSTSLPYATPTLITIRVCVSDNEDNLFDRLIASHPGAWLTKTKDPVRIQRMFYEY